MDRTIQGRHTALHGRAIPTRRPDQNNGLDGVERLIAYLTLPHLPPGSPLYVAVGIPYAKVVAGTQATLLRSSLSLSIITALMLLFAWFGGHYFLLRKISVLVDASRRLTQGDLATRTGISGSSELDRLAHTFDEMASTLQTREAELLGSEQAHRETLELLEKIFSTVHVHIVYLDADFNFIRVNRAYADICGYPAEFFVGKNHFALYPNEENEAIFRRVVETGEPYAVYAKPFTFPDHPERGVTYWDWTLHPVHDTSGRINGLVFCLIHVTDRVCAQEKIQFLAYHDELTGLPNRALLLDHLNHDLIDAHRHQRLVAVLCLDLNDFKNVNDTLGHDLGNQVIKTLATRLSESLRPGDTVARLGGDEFCVVLADLAHLNDIADLIQKILNQFTRSIPILDHNLYLTAALGISTYPNDGHDPEILLGNANIAMYRAKDSGDSYQYYSADMTANASERLALENDLRHALERKELLLHYQPQVSLATGKITGVEALVRWQHPVRGLISPAKFIPLAESTNLIIPIGAWVLRTACAQCQAWQEQGLPPLHMAVNFSARQFRLPNLETVIQQILDDTALDPRLLDIELTESILVQNPEAMAVVLGQMEKLGAHISIDDFGTGYSSLSYLKRFPIDILKIDQSFVRDIVTDPDDAAIALAIINMARALGMQTIAEGVETVEQLDFLRRHGCDAIQGYYFSRPVEASGIVALFREQKRLSGNL